MPGIGLGVGIGLNKPKVEAGGSSPVNTVSPEITGTLEVGQTLTCSTGTWTGTPTITYSYQWKRGVTNIGTDSSTYIAVYADIGENITCTVTATNDYGSNSEVSNTVLVSITLNYIINLFGFSNAWSSENLTIAGTTTTANDYKGVHNLTNPGATNQPTFNPSSSNFGGKPSLIFSGVDDYLIKNTANFNNVASGFQIDVFKATTPRVLTSSDNATNARYTRGYMNGGKIGFELVFVTNRFTANTLAWNTAVGNVVAYGSNASAYLISLNGASNSGADLNILNGADNGEWFSRVGLRDNVAIGGTITSTPTYANIEWVFSGVGTNSSEADLNLLTLLLKEYYNLP